MVFYSQIIFLLSTGCYVLYYHILDTPSIQILSGSYSQEYRLIGFTGYVYDFDKIYRLGNTSVNMGVYVALILFW